MPDDVQIREATPADAPAIASIHVQAWRAAYRGLMPDTLLDGLSVERRARGWQRSLSEPEAGQAVWVAERAGRVIGFASTGRSGGPEADEDTAELFTVYLEPDAIGMGVGRELFAHAVQHLREQGFGQATLWVLATNDRARRFYEAAGWSADGGERLEPWGEFELHEVRYRFDL